MSKLKVMDCPFIEEDNQFLQWTMKTGEELDEGFLYQTDSPIFYDARDMHVNYFLFKFTDSNYKKITRFQYREEQGNADDQTKIKIYIRPRPTYNSTPFSVLTQQRYEELMRKRNENDESETDSSESISILDVEKVNFSLR